MRTHYKAWAEPFLNEHPEFVIKSEDIKNHLDNDKVKVMEIGSGKGQLIYRMSIHHPECLYFAMERNVTCAGFLAKKIIENPYGNCFVVNDDFEKAASLIPDESMDIIMLSFPDPWPKKRHEKRRLVSTRLLNIIIPKLKKGGYLRLKTDNDGLFEFAKKEFSKSVLKEVMILESLPAYTPCDEMSEYEESFRKENHDIHCLVFQKEK